MTSPTSSPRVTVVGAGAIGLLYGGWLRQAGLDVRFVARGERAAILNAGPIEARGRLPFRLPSIPAFRTAQEAGPADVLLLAVKLYDLEEAALQAAAGLAPGGSVVAIQNGVRAFETLGKVFPSSRIAVGPVYSVTKQVGGASVEYAGPERVVLGNPVAAIPPQIRTLVEAWASVGVDASLSDDITTVLWTKFIGLATGAAMTTLGRLPAGIVYHDPALVAVARRSIDEVIRVGEAEGIDFPEGAADRAMALLQSFPANSVASMRLDLDAGRRLEIEATSGEIVRLARRHDIPVPFHEMAYAMLRPFRDGRPASSDFDLTSSAAEKVRA